MIAAARTGTQLFARGNLIVTILEVPHLWSHLVEWLAVALLVLRVHDLIDHRPWPHKCGQVPRLVKQLCVGFWSMNTVLTESGNAVAGQECATLQ